MTTFITLLLTLSTHLCLAHEGDHGPGQFQPLHGGIVQSVETLHLELVHDKDQLRLYVYDRQGMPASPEKYPIRTKIQLPLKKTQAIEMKPAGDHWVATYVPPAEARRFTLELYIEQAGHKDTLMMTIEKGKNK